MQAQALPKTMRAKAPPITLLDVPAGVDDPLAEIDVLMQEQLDKEQRSADATARVLADRAKFATEFTAVCDQRVRPPMEVILQRLRQNGGGGLIDERPADATRHHSHRLTLWMSLRGEITGAPRQDRHPYLELDANVDRALVTISEGDIWNGHGGSSSGPVGQRPLAEITETFITSEVLAVIRRSLRAPAAASTSKESGT